MEINASEFKAKCLAILDEVFATGRTVTILKRGRPVAQLVPPVPRDEGFPQQSLAGSVEIRGDVVDPVIEPGTWEAEAGSGEAGAGETG
jgi:prevent-host-death family protein